jgi:hypothetical protein
LRLRAGEHNFNSAVAVNPEAGDVEAGSLGNLQGALYITLLEAVGAAGFAGGVHAASRILTRWLLIHDSTAQSSAVRIVETVPAANYAARFGAGILPEGQRPR